ncbi:MAG TPA: DUF4390 domain-containing protein [Burkholderiaceae bacterium]|nr:DUF4390 domain-containing protein [Burkholderiaceae bacterium]
MSSVFWVRWFKRPRAAVLHARTVFLALVAALATLLCALPAAAQAPELMSFEVERNEDGVTLNYAVNFELPRSVEDALQKGVPLYFLAEAEVYRSRWYWRDKRMAQASRSFRLTWQPLTRRYRVTLGGLSQSYERMDEALATIQRASHWKVADANQLDDDARHYVEFSFRLDTSQLPRPMQIGFGGQADWSLQLERSARVPDLPGR